MSSRCWPPPACYSADGLRPAAAPPLPAEATEARCPISQSLHPDVRYALKLVRRTPIPAGCGI